VDRGIRQSIAGDQKRHPLFRHPDGYSLASILVAIGALGILMVALISFTNNSARTLKYQEHASAFDESAILVQRILKKRCDKANFISTIANTTAQTGFPVRLAVLPAIKFDQQTILKLGKNSNFTVDKIEFMQDGPVIGKGSRIVPTHISVEASLPKGTYRDDSGKRVYDTKRVIRRFPILVSLDENTDQIVGCATPMLSRKNICASRGGTWQGDYSTPRCLLP
jgi:hypothetical protein